MQIHQSVAYRLAYETATLELNLIQGAMKKLQQEKDRVEDALAAIEPESTSYGNPLLPPITVN
jgi:hypothetical protein